MIDETSVKIGMWRRKPVSLVLVGVALGVTLWLPGAGVIAAFVLTLVAALWGRKYGSFGDMGMRSPDSWPKLVATTFVYGVVVQLAFTMLVEPILERITGSAVDISVLDSVRGNFLGLLTMLAAGWILGGFLEEFTFRGFVVTRVRKLLDDGSVATWFAVLAAAVPFGLAHAYQGPAGMIATGLVGFVLGAMFVYHEYNLWYPVFVHGFINTVAMTLIYLDIDHRLTDVLF